MFRKKKDVNIHNIERVVVQVDDVQVVERGNVAKRLGELEETIQKMRDDLTDYAEQQTNEHGE